MTAVVEVIENPVTITVEGDTVTVQSITEVATLQLATSGPQGPSGPHLPTFSRTGTLTPTAGTGRYYLEVPCAVSFIRAAVDVAPTGAGIVVAVNVNGVQQTTATIPAGQFTSTKTVNIPLAADDFLTVDILAVGSTVAGSDLTVTLTIS